MVVLDNCALFEILRKSDRGRALQELLMVEEKVISVELIRAEAVSVLRKLVVTGKITKGDAGSMLAVAMDLIDEFYPMTELQIEAMNEGIRLNHSTYDMFYFVLARRMGATLFTLDNKLAQLCEENGVDCIHEVELR